MQALQAPMLERHGGQARAPPLRLGPSSKLTSLGNLPPQMQAWLPLGTISIIQKILSDSPSLNHKLHEGKAYVGAWLTAMAPRPSTVFRTEGTQSPDGEWMNGTGKG